MPRILIVDDNESIHRDFLKVLDSEGNNKLRDVEMALFGEDEPEIGPENLPIKYEIDNAYQGEEAVQMVADAMAQKNPYAVIFMDVRMPPGLDGIKASSAIWRRFPDTEIVICSAHSDYSWAEMLAEIGATDKLQFLRKPFDMVTVQQLALSCSKKWELLQTTRKYIRRLETENSGRQEEQSRLEQRIRELEKQGPANNHNRLAETRMGLEQCLEMVPVLKAQLVQLSHDWQATDPADLASKVEASVQMLEQLQLRLSDLASRIRH